jgi:hypothetical protein
MRYTLSNGERGELTIGDTRMRTLAEARAQAMDYWRQINAGGVHQKNYPTQYVFEEDETTGHRRRVPARDEMLENLDAQIAAAGTLCRCASSKALCQFQECAL